MSKSEVVLFNSGKNPISGLDGGKPYKLMPQTALCFSVEEAAKLKKLYRDNLIDEADARAKFSPAQVMADVAKNGAAPVSETPKEREAAPVKMGPLSDEDKEKIVIGLTDTLKMLAARGTSHEEISAMAAAAKVRAQIEMEPEANSKMTPDEIAEAIRLVRANEKSSEPITADVQESNAVIEKIKSILKGLA